MPCAEAYDLTQRVWVTRADRSRVSDVATARTTPRVAPTPQIKGKVAGRVSSRALLFYLLVAPPVVLCWGDMREGLRSILVFTTLHATAPPPHKRKRQSDLGTHRRTVLASVSQASVSQAWYNSRHMWYNSHPLRHPDTRRHDLVSLAADRERSIRNRQG